MSSLSKHQAIAKLEELVCLANQGKQQEAVVQFNQLTAQLPDDIDVTVQVGNLCMTLGDLAQAKATFSRVVDKYPENPIYLTLLAKVFHGTKQFAEAAVLLHKAIDIKPDLVSAMVELSVIYFSLRHYDEATSLLERALKLQPKDAEILSNVATCLTLQKRYAEAIKLGEKSLKLNPDLTNTYMTLGIAYSEFGGLGKAISHYEKAIKKDKTIGAAYAQLAKIKKYTEADRGFVDNTERVLSESLTPKARSDVHFALGKIYDDLKQWDRAFEHYRKGNLLGKSQFAEAHMGNASRGLHSVGHYLKLSKKVFTRKLLASGLSGSDSAVPVFVVGMPRSGSTLIEQIISSHPKAAAAGEMKDFGNLMMSICQPDSVANFRAAWGESLNQDKLQSLAGQYLESLTYGHKGTQRIVDKMPDNYNFLGPIALLFPNARIIHSIRNPVDTCLSCYFQRFNEVGWSYDLKQIAERYCVYREAIKYWKSVLPEEHIYEVHYEDLIADPELQSRKLIEACRLEWDPACLNYYDQNHSIATASLWQARQPIYKSSVRRWAHYAPYIGDLLNGIADYLDEDDHRIMKENGIKPHSWLRRVFF